MRKEDYEPRRTPPESQFRSFRVSCNKCNSFKLTVTAHYDDQSRCRQQEKLVIR